MAAAAPDARTPGRSPPPSEGAPSIAERSNGQSANTSRRTSLGFLRRSRSSEPLADRKFSGGGGKTSKKQREQQAREEENRRHRVSQQPPRLPNLTPPPQLGTFGGEDIPDTVNESRMSLPAPDTNFASSSFSSPPSSAAGPDPYARTESMTHRGRSSYASSNLSNINSPRRLRRRKDPTPYNILVIGARNSGKTSFVDFLRRSLTMPSHKHPTRPADELNNPGYHSSGGLAYTSQYLETEVDGERIGVTLWDSQGLDRSVVDIQLRGVAGFLESKFEETLREEMKVVRSPGVRDTHIHCTFLLLDPVNLDANIAAAERAANGYRKPTDPRVTGILDDRLDIQVLRAILGKTTVVPVISKADTVTTSHMAYLKKAVWSSLKRANIDPLEILTLENEEEHSSSGSDYENEDGRSKGSESPIHGEKPLESPSAANQVIPFSTLSPDRYSLEYDNEPVGRRFPWGFADPYDLAHCDFVKLKDAVFGDWRSELRVASREVWYERWRTNRLNRNGNVMVPHKHAYGGNMGVFADGRRVR